MSKRSNTTTKVSNSFADKEGRYDMYQPRERKSNPAAVIVGGYMSLPVDYEAMGREIADRGVPVIIPELLRPLSGEPLDPLKYRFATVNRAIEDSKKYLEFDSISLIGHSFGGATLAMLSIDAPVKVERVNYISAVGFDNVLEGSLIEQLDDVIKFGLLELVPSIFQGALTYRRARRIGQILRHMSPFDMELRLKEALTIKHLGGHNLPFILNSRDKVKNVVYGGPADHLVSWQKTLESVGGLLPRQDVREIHPLAHHLAPQAFARHVANILLDKETSVEHHILGALSTHADNKSSSELTSSLDIKLPTT